MRFKVPNEILMGNDIVKTLPDGYFRKFGKKALIVTGPKVAKTKMFSTLMSSLERSDMETAVFDDIDAEPTVAMINSGVKKYKLEQCDFVVGLGGGSPLDAAKAIAAMSVLPGSISDYLGTEIEGDIPPIICLPTTAGTGSEATRFTIITDDATNVKMLLKGEALLPSAAIVDYSFSADAPLDITIASALDALTHAIEAYISIKHQPLTDSFALSAIMGVVRHLPRVLKNPADIVARGELAVAALEGGICINNSSVTLVHGMSRPIGALFHVPHGISNAMLLCTCLLDIYATENERIDKISHHMRMIDGMMFIDKVSELVRQCGIRSIGSYGIERNEFLAVIDKMAEDAMASGSPANAPKKYTAEIIKKLYLKAF